MNPSHSLTVYVIGVIIVLAVVNGITWLVGGMGRFRTMELVSLGFLLGMLAMYIAMHVYRW